ncbi:MAG: bile acid:sodium symporter family protein [Phreatobacter sp.]
MVSRILARLPIDPYLLALAATVGFAALVPAEGAGAHALDLAVRLAIALLFFLYGARLAPRAVAEGMAHWRLQSLVLASTFVLFPLVGLALTTALKPWLSPDLALGLMFVSVLPSTVQSSIAFTAIARGNVPAALCSATVSNLAGIAMTPLLVGLLLNARGSGFSVQALEGIALQLLLPFALGQCARPWLGGFLARHQAVTALVDRGSILLIVYSAFSAGMVAGIWSQIDRTGLELVVALSVVMLAAVLAITTMVSRRLGFIREDEIAIVFCGSKKSLASGISMANILFAGQPVGLIVLPLMLFHQAQLFACAMLAQRYAARATATTAPGLAPR